VTASIFVVGPEGSGTTVVWRCIAAHPDLRRMRVREAPNPRRAFPAAGLLLHLSLPTLRPMRWVRPDELPRGAKVVVVRRSAVHTVYSAYRRFYRDPAAAWRAYFRAVDLEARYIADCNPACVAYEDLVCNPAKVLGALYSWIGVDADFLPPIRLDDRNDERWRADEIFNRFMLGAFGSVDGSAVVATGGQRSGPPGAKRPTRSAAKHEGTARRPGAGEERKGVVRTRYVRIPDVLAQRDHARLVDYVRTRTGRLPTGRRFAGDRQPRAAAAAERSDEIWRTLEERLRRLFPYVRRELLLPWAPIGRLEWQATMERTPAAVLEGSGEGTSGPRGPVTCVYTVVPGRGEAGRGQLRLVDGRRRRRSGERSVRIELADNAAVFFVGGLQSQTRSGRRRPSSGSRPQRVSIAVSFTLGEAPPLLRLSAAASSAVP
jgi:hypothetical protein